MQKKSLFLLSTFLPCDRMMISGVDCVSDGDAAATCKTLGSPATLCFISCRYECVWTWPGAWPGGTHRTSTHTNCTRTHTHSRANRHKEPVLQLSSLKNAAMQHLPTGLFFVLYNITTTKQTQNKVFYFSDSLLCLLRSVSLFTWLTRPQQPSVFLGLSLVELKKSSKELCFVWSEKNQDINVY